MYSAGSLCSYWPCLYSLSSRSFAVLQMTLWNCKPEMPGQKLLTTLTEGEQHYFPCLSRHGGIRHIFYDYGDSADLSSLGKIWEISCDNSLRFCYREYARSHPWGSNQQQLRMEVDISIEVCASTLSIVTAEVDLFTSFSHIAHRRDAFALGLWP